MYADILKLIATARHRRPSSRLDRRLDTLLPRLADIESPIMAETLQDQIWQLWMTYPDRGAGVELERATRAIVASDFGAAKRILDRLVALHPRFAEAWHKRATLHYMLQHDEASVRDFHRTLALEPRHFGAMLTFAELCLAHGRRDQALFAIHVALSLNPHLADIWSTYQTLLVERQSTAH